MDSDWSFFFGSLDYGNISDVSGRQVDNDSPPRSQQHIHKISYKSRQILNSKTHHRPSHENVSQDLDCQLAGKPAAAEKRHMQTYAKTSLEIR